MLHRNTNSVPNQQSSPDRPHQIRMSLLGGLAVLLAVAPYVHAAADPGPQTHVTARAGNVDPLPAPPLPTPDPYVYTFDPAAPDPWAGRIAAAAANRAAKTAPVPTAAPTTRPSPTPSITTPSKRTQNAAKRKQVAAKTPPTAKVPASPLPANLAPLPGSGGQAAGHAETYLVKDGGARRWAACPSSPIRYQVYAGNGPADAVTLARKAVDVVAAATGLPFEYVGETKTSPPTDYDFAKAPDVPVTIGWVAPGESILPKKRDGQETGPVGLATTWVTTPMEADDNGTPFQQVVAGSVAVSTALPDTNLDSGVRAHYLVLLHELGHMVGLDHVHVDDVNPRTGKPFGDSARTQLMYPKLQQGHTKFGAGDLAGLAEVGMSNPKFSHCSTD